MFGRKTRERVAGKATLGVARGAGKAALGAGKVVKGGAKSRTARKATGRAARGASRVALKGGKQVASPGQSAGSRFLRYGFFAIAGFAVGALVARSSSREDASSSWGSGTPTGTAGGAAGTVSDPTRPESPQRPEDPNRTGTGRDYSDPSAGPLIGRSHRGRIGDVPEQQEEVENRIRTRVGEDPRTADVPHLNVEVNDSVADIRGEVHSEEEKQAVEEIASSVEGVTEVRNLLTVNPDAPTRRV
ncbi:MAG: BON domain-containing protein [Actinobacteria bacterium]|nr:BON domain-containing protein [Actinomycetota bacterium]